MAPRGRPRKRTESGTSIATEPDAEAEAEVEATTSTSRPRRSRIPKRYLEDDYSPPPKRRATQRKPTPSESREEEEDIKLTIKIGTPKTPKTPAAPVSVPSSKSTTRPRGRPPRPSISSNSRRKSKKIEEEVFYMDEDSDDVESSDEEFEPPLEEPEEPEEELEFTDDVKVLKEEEDEAFCPWLEDPETLPKLELPESSQDIPLPNNATFDAMEVYEILRSYHRTLRITPFTFEDFCAALISKNNSCIIAEVHMALLRICLKSDDEEQTHYSVTETNNSVNIMLHHLDTLTFGEVLRQYIEAYPYTDQSVLDAINTDNYPYCGYEPKIIVLMFMCYRFLYSSEYKKVINNVGKFQNDDNCRVCGKSSGRIVGCVQCEAAFHVDCSRLNPFPEVLICNICKSNSLVRGVANSLPQALEPVERELIRSTPIGRDRYGRYYWFVARRLVVQSLDETELHYYSTPPQLFQLTQKLDRNYYEKALCEAIKNRMTDILEHMTTTAEMASERRDMAIDGMMKKNAMGYEYVESITPQSFLNKDNMRRMAVILRDLSSIKKEPKHEPEENGGGANGSGPIEFDPFEEDAILPASLIGIHEGILVNTFWSGGATQEELFPYPAELMEENFEPGRYWRMGDETNDQTFMAYQNIYSKNDMAESSATRKKIADKKKYMASRFNILENFEWVVAKDRQFYGNNVLHTKFVSWTLGKIARKIPADLMHRRWLEVQKAFDIDCSAADDYKKLAMCLLKLDAAARKTIFMPQWWSGLGQTKMERNTAEMRESFTKEQQKIKKLEADALSKDLDDTWIRVNYSKPKWPNTYILRQKGETYRNAGKGEMGGWLWISNKYEKRLVPIPKRPKLPLAASNSPSNRKARNLELLVSKIKKKRDAAEHKKNHPETSNFELINKCYSMSCTTRKDPNVLYNPACYSTSCRSGHLAAIRQKREDEELAKKGVLGEEKPWPIPEIQTFSTRKNGKKSIFVLQKNSRILRQMIATAGCQSVYMPGFAPTAKSNLLVWNYPAPRPTLDLCWKFQTLNSRSLHAVALMLKIMWSSIKWNEFEPEDSHPDRRVVIDTPNHDERRRIVRHKEMPPFGQYERYELEIEIIPLYEDHEEEDESWTTRRDRSGDVSRVSNRKVKRPNRGPDNRTATSVRYEWVDGVTLKVFEIKDYWKAVRAEMERQAKRKAEAARKAVKAREDAEKARLHAMALATARPKPLPSLVRSSSDRINVPYIGPRGTGHPAGGRYLEQYNNSQIPPRTSNHMATSASAAQLGTPGSSQHQNQHYHHQQQQQQYHQQYQQPSQQQYNQNYPLSHQYHPSTTVRQVVAPVLRRVPSTNPHGDFQRAPSQYQQYQQQTRAVAGADGTVTYRAMPSQQQYQSGQYYPQQPGRLTANGYQFPDNHRVNQRAPQQRMRPIPHSVMLKPFGEPEMRRAMPVAEEAVSANAAGSDGDEQPPVIPRYDRNTPTMEQQQMPSQPRGPPQQMPRQVYNVTGGQQMLRIPSGGIQGGPKGIIVVKQTDGTQKMLVRPVQQGQSSSQQQINEYPPGTVLAGAPRVMTIRPPGGSGQPQQQGRQVFASGQQPRFVRIQQTPQQGQPQPNLVRRVIPPQQRQQQMFQEYADDQGMPQQQGARYVLQGSQVPMKLPRVAPRGGMTMQMVQQQQHPDSIPEDNQMVDQEPMFTDSTGFEVAPKEQEEQ